MRGVLRWVLQNGVGVWKCYKLPGILKKQSNGGDHAAMHVNRGLLLFKFLALTSFSSVVAYWHRQHGCESPFITTYFSLSKTITTKPLSTTKSHTIASITIYALFLLPVVVILWYYIIYIHIRYFYW